MRSYVGTGPLRRPSPPGPGEIIIAGAAATILVVNVDWSPSAKYCAQVTHLLASVCIILAADMRHYNLWITTLFLTVITAAKEFWADLTWLEHDTLAGSCEDFFFYCWGTGSGLLSLSRFWLGVVLVVLAILGLVLVDMVQQGVITL